MRYFALSTIIPILFLMYSCQDSPTKTNDEAIIGVWIDQEFDSETGETILSSASEFANDKYGIAFYADGTLVERKNAGWCGTPPITYKNYEGTWTALNDSTFTIDVGYWGGEITYVYNVRSISADELRCLYDYE